MIGGPPSVRFCDNPPCEAPAVKRVRVSVNAPGDEFRWYCYTCYEAYMVGRQHGRFITERKSNGKAVRSP